MAPDACPPAPTSSSRRTRSTPGAGITGSGWSGGTHVCSVEVDLETGAVKILRYIVVEDCGRVINPAIVEGQIRGGVAQGIGGVLYEHSAYDEDGQLPRGDVHGLSRSPPRPSIPTIMHWRTSDWTVANLPRMSTFRPSQNHAGVQGEESVLEVPRGV